MASIPRPPSELRLEPAQGRTAGAKDRIPSLLLSHAFIRLQLAEGNLERGGVAGYDFLLNSWTDPLHGEITADLIFLFIPVQSVPRSASVRLRD